VAEPQRRLLVVATVPATIRAFLVPYADHLRARGWQVDAMTGPGSSVSGLSESFDTVHVVPWSRSPSDLDNLTRARSRVRRLVGDGNYDVVHTHTPVASFVTRAAMIGLRRRPRVVYTAHGFHFHPLGRRLTNTLHAAAERSMGRWTDRLVVINDQDYAAALSRHIVPLERLVQMPGIGIDLETYRPDSASPAEVAAVRTRLGLGPDDLVFTVLAELNPGKNHETVLRAVAHNGDRRLRLLLAGEGPERDRLLALAQKLGIADQVQHLGTVGDVRPLVLSSIATILLSRREGLSRAVMESLAMGVPVIGSTSRGVADLLGSGGGIVVEPDDVVAAAQALDDVGSLARGWNLRRDLDGLLESLSLVRLLQRHEALYQSLLEQTP
jgi:glycosyltransferase involved in cell wall biosynthesis